ncbi:hypothetical protein Peur_040854 [Populus x canadensis]
MRCASNDRSMGGVSMFGVAKMVFFKPFTVWVSKKDPAFTTHFQWGGTHAC